VLTLSSVLVPCLQGPEYQKRIEARAARFAAGAMAAATPAKAAAPAATPVATPAPVVQTLAPVQVCLPCCAVLLVGRRIGHDSNMVLYPPCLVRLTMSLRCLLRIG
jgi:hypothetical protein